jgi:hypothetical protein
VANVDGGRWELVAEFTEVESGKRNRQHRAHCAARLLSARRKLRYFTGDERLLDANQVQSVGGPGVGGRP